MEALGLNLGYLLVQIFMFGILFVTLRAWVYKPVLDLLEKRRKTVAQGLEDARIAAEARANAERDAESILVEAQAKANQVIRDATEKAESVALDIKNQAEVDTEKLRAVKLEEVNEERNRLLGELRGQVAALSIAAAQKLIGEALDEKRQHALLEEFFSGVKDGKVIVMDNANLLGHEAEVTSALPLTEKEQACVREDVLSKMGANTTISFRIDPTILGGLVIRVGDKVMDGSVAGQLQTLRQSLR